MAISGAAANPNMGRASSPALSFLMTVFNVRLGWWIGNPRHRTGALMPGPPFGLTYIALELFGGTDDNRNYVNLSDGGHFDNLGVYELIRRSCRYIMVCDAGQIENSFAKISAILCVGAVLILASRSISTSIASASSVQPASAKRIV